MKHRKLLLLATTFIFSAGFGTCATPVHSICASTIPKFEGEIEATLATLEGFRLEPDKKKGPSRAIASLSGDETPDLYESMNQDEKDFWSRWARRRLSDVQQFLDDLDPHPAYRKQRAELMNVANELVSFHGYVEVGDTWQSYKHLSEARKHILAIYAGVCGSQ